MGNKDKKEVNIPHVPLEMSDSEDDLIEVVDLAEDVLSDSSDTVVLVNNLDQDSESREAKTLENCNISTILLDPIVDVTSNKTPNVCGSTPNKNISFEINSPIVIDDSLDNSVVQNTCCQKRKRHLPSFIDLCDNSDVELNIQNKKPKINDVIVIPDTPVKKIKVKHTKKRKSLLKNSKGNKKYRKNPYVISCQEKNPNVYNIISNPGIESIHSTNNKLHETPSSISSFSNVGYNVYNPNVFKRRTGLRPIIIDGSNVAVQHGIATGTKDFSVAGIDICIDFFEKKGHMVKVFIPHFRLASNFSSNPKRLQELEKQGKVICTPSRKIRGRTVASYDDRYIVQTAAEFEGIIVSNDNYRDLLNENPTWRTTIEERLLMFTWVDNCLMFPIDPLGRYGPCLEAFLRF